MNYNKIRSFCRKFRIVLGTFVLIIGFYFTKENQIYNIWFLLGFIPLIVGILNFCPLCIITKKCDIEEK
jgi:membrane-associated protease RseP (regulator of RpoE activity)